MVGERQLPVPREVVWAALNDVDVLKACVPGCESINEVGERKYEVVMQAAIGPIKARFKGTMQISDAVAPKGYSLAFEGAGGAAGFARGGAHVDLAEIDTNNTLLQYRSEATVGGKLAQIGARLVDSAARVMADRFFDAFVKALQDAGASEEGVDSSNDDRSTKAQVSGFRGMLRRLKGGDPS
ncbi:CoxG family protein [Pigmentiphaga humi]|nr:carbon monoxide dehydrogenase subunit G [Pigmentiphaga humi]